MTQLVLTSCHTDVHFDREVRMFEAVNSRLSRSPVHYGHVVTADPQQSVPPTPAVGFL